jgi:DNA-binding ferritin-like protein
MAEYLKRPLKSGTETGPKADHSKHIATLVFELMVGATKVHINHLLVTGTGSYAAHKAMNEFYDAAPDLADDVAEQFQGVTEKLLTFPTSANLPTMKTAEDCIKYLRGLYDLADMVHEACGHSEIQNTIDEIKSLINSTKYKLLFLK